jgi:hypothetical protein
VIDRARFIECNRRLQDRIAATKSTLGRRSQTAILEENSLTVPRLCAPCGTPRAWSGVGCCSALSWRRSGAEGLHRLDPDRVTYLPVACLAAMGLSPRHSGTQNYSDCASLPA